MKLDQTRPSPPAGSEAVLAQLDRIFSSDIFAASPRLREFLSYVVDETLAGRAARIKGLTIAQDVFQRGNLEDPQETTIVRVEAARLRRCLDDYYQTEGQRDPVHIQIPKGTYVPSFAPVSTENEDGEPRSPGELPQSRRFRFKTIELRTAAVLTSLLAVAALLWGFLVLREEPTVQSQPLAGPTVIDEFTKPAIAVLPFESTSGEAAGAIFAMRLTEDIIMEFSKLSGIDVIAMSSILTIMERNSKIQNIGERLRVSHILRGTVDYTQQQIHVTSQLLDSQTGKVIWSMAFDRQLKDYLDLQSEIVINVAERLSVSFRGGERERVWSASMTPVTGEARILYKQALSLFRPPSDPARLQIARQAFEKVIEDAPDFAGGYAGVALVDAFYVYFGHSQSPEEDIRKALKFADKAIEIDPSFGLAFSASAFANLARRNFDTALAASSQAVRLQPNDPYVNAYHGFILSTNGQAARGIDYGKRALRLDPLAVRVPYRNLLGFAYFHNAQYQEALNAILGNAERGGPRGPGSQAYLVATYASLGRHDEARAALEVLNTGGGGFAWEDWIRRSFRYERDVELVLRPIRDLGMD